MANIITNNYNLNISPGGVPTPVYVNQNENGRALKFKLVSESNFTIPSGSTATFEGTKPDGNIYSNTASLDITNKVVTVQEAVQMTAAAGEYPAKIKIINGGNAIATGLIKMVVSADSTNGGTQSDSVLAGLAAQMQSYINTYGNPWIAETASAMTNHDKIYVYTGSESGYTFGNWYYWNGSVWTSGGVYNSTGINVDDTLSVAGKAADAKATGDVVGDLKGAIDNVEEALLYESDVVWELGNINYIGVEETSSVRARTDEFIPLNAVVSVASGGKYGYRFYDASGTFTESPYFSGNARFTSDTTSPSDIKTNPLSVKCRIVFRADPETTITVAQAEQLMTVELVSSPFPQINSLEESVTEIESYFSEYFPETWETGQFSTYDGAVTSAPNYSLARVNVETLEGESITIHSWVNAYAGCPIMAKDGTLVMKTSDSRVYEPTEVTFNVTLPIGAAYVYLTTLNNHIDEAYVKFNGQLTYPLPVLQSKIDNIAESIQGSETNPLLKIDNYPVFIDCFLTVGVIGDSLASGESYYNDNGSGASGLVDIYKHSWGQYLARMTGNTYYNFSKGGLSTKTWLSSQYATQCFDGNHNCTAYIIGLGQNDKNQSYTIGTSADIHLNNYNANADTFYGSYGKIIQKIKELVPKAKIFVVTDPLDSVDSAGYNTAIRAMASIFTNVYVVDIRQYGRNMYYSGLIKQSNRNGHYNAIAYRLMASIIGTYISWIIEHNPLEFKAIEFIDTQYSVT